MLSPFENDILDQPGAVTALLASDLPNLAALESAGFTRIVLTGMGSSHYAGNASWRALCGAIPTWWVPTSELLDLPQLLDSQTLLWITSQSGESGEVVELLRRIQNGLRVFGVLGMTNDPQSTLGRKADYLWPLHSGTEATVSTKSYLNTCVAHAFAVRQLLGQPVAQLMAEAKHLPELIRHLVEDPLSTQCLDAVASTKAIGYVGGLVSGASAQMAALITKEAAKVPAEGFVGGEFRHGPFEMAGRNGFAVVIFTADAGRTTANLRQLSDDLVTANTTVLTIGDEPWPGTIQLPTPTAAGELTQLVAEAIRVQQLTVALAKAAGLPPGHFFHGQKITDAL